MGDNHLVPLGFMSPGESGILKEIRGLRHHLNNGKRDTCMRPTKQYRRGHMHHSDRSHRLEHRLNYMGLVPGELVKIVQNNAPGPVVVAVKGSRLCLGRGIACKLMVSLGHDDPGACGADPAEGEERDR